MHNRPVPWWRDVQWARAVTKPAKTDRTFPKCSRVSHNHSTPPVVARYTLPGWSPCHKRYTVLWLVLARFIQTKQARTGNTHRRISRKAPFSKQRFFRTVAFLRKKRRDRCPNTYVVIGGCSTVSCFVHQGRLQQQHDTSSSLGSCSSSSSFQPRQSIVTHRLLSGYYWNTV